MANQAIKQMFMKRLFDNQLAKQAATKAGEIFGQREQVTDVHRPDPSSPFGLMNVEQEVVPATGLFEAGVPEREKFMRASRQMVESGSPMLQQKGLDMLSSMQGSMMSGAGASPTTFAFGAGDGKMQRGYLKGGELEKLGSPYDPRNPYLDIGTGFVDPNDPDGTIQKQLAQQKFEEQRGMADQSFYNDFTSETAVIEESVYENNETKRLLNEMSGLAKHDTVGFGSWLRKTPLADATYVAELKSTIQSRLALAKMMALKAASSTGSTGFGALSEKELKLLTDYQGSLALAQNPEDIKKVILKIYNHLEHSNSEYSKKLQRNKEKYVRLHKKYDPTSPLPASVAGITAPNQAGAAGAAGGDANVIVKEWGSD